MKVNANPKRSIIEQLALAILTRLEKNLTFSQIDYLKCKLGIETLLIEASKLIVVYGLAAIMGIPWETFLFHLGYMAIRTFTHGAHSESSFYCTIISCVILVGSPLVLTMIWLPRLALLGIVIINHLLIITYAPAATRKNGIWRLSSVRKKKLRYKAMIANLVTFLISILVLPVSIGTLLIIGSFIASLMMTPLASHLLKSERIDNNEKFNNKN